MNIKSLILGSAAALVAGGAAQAADLPVAEPVDYVKVCNAYGAGYHFIPGTDTCLKVSGYVRAEFRFDEPAERSDDTTSIYAKASLNFTAKEETELGTLVAYMRLENDTAGGDDDGFNKYYLSIGGLYAGLTDSAANITTTDKAMYGSTLGDHDTGALGYNFDIGNGVTLGVALENSRKAEQISDTTYYFTTGGGSVTKAVYDAAAPANRWTQVVAGESIYAGQALPDIVAGLSVNQGWGSAKIGGAVHQIRYANANIGTDYGYYIGAGVNFNLDMLSAGSEIGFSAGYAKGAVGYIRSSSSTTPVADATITGTGATATAKLNSIYKMGAALKYAWASNFNTYLTGAYENYNNETSNAGDFKAWNVGFVAEYLPVNNLIVRAGVNYTKTDWSAASGKKDVDNWEGKLRLQRDF